RNRAVGERIGKGESLQEILSSMEKVAEGIFTVKSTRELACRLKVEMPITEVVYQILYKGMSPSEGVKSLMLRTPREEPERFIHEK
ncbi:MAG: glycerol-3-phosphate dehydrogenase, partial [Caldiserica bacterium]|nr:glycerol-3-phosphate dehydrogenase [Caldisericota bacterium]